MSYIKSDDRNQTLKFNCIDDMVEKENPVRIIDLFIDKFFHEQPNEFTKAKDSNFGAPSYHPSAMLKLYFYGYINQIKSSRKLERECGRNLEIIWLLGNLRPDHWTISNFRKSQGDKIKKVWNLFKLFLKSNDYIDLKLVAIDGTKVKAFTKREMLTLESINKTIKYSESKLEQYLQSLELQDTNENYQEELLEKLAKLESKLEKYEGYKQLMEDKGLVRLAVTEPEVNLVKSRDGKHPGYNVQAVTDFKYHMIAEIDETTEENDLHQLTPMINKVRETYIESPLSVAADTGYYNPEAIEEVVCSGIDLYVSPKKEKEPDGVDFKYDNEKDIYVCSEGKELQLYSRNVKKRNSIADVYRCKDCKNCSKFGTCTTSDNGRVHSRYKNQEFRDSYEEKMRSSEGKKMMKIRKSLVEHPFGTIKYLMGKIPLLLRGKEKVSVEIKLYAMAYNFKRLINISSYDTIVEQIAAFSCK
jgi:transposase